MNGVAQALIVERVWREFLETIPSGWMDSAASEFLFDLVNELVDHGIVEPEQLLDLARQLKESSS